MVEWGTQIDFIIRCLSMHFIFACATGLLVFFLTWTILSRVCVGQTTFRSPFFAGLFFAVLSHLIIDTYTTLG